MITDPPSFNTDNTERLPPANGLRAGAFILAFLLVYGLGFAFEGEIRQVMVAGLNSLPFMLLAVLAYLGRSYLWAQMISIVYLVILVGLTVLMGLGLTFVAGAGALRTLLLLAGSGLAVLIGALAFVPAVRRAASRILPIDPASFVHTVALAGITAITMVCFGTLAAAGAPPLLTMVENATATGVDVSGGRGDTGLLLDLIYGLMWTVPATVIAVGYGVRRSLGEALERLGLVRPTLRQALAGLGLAVALVAAVQLLSLGITWLWQAMGWPQTNEEAFGELLSFAMNPLGAVVIGVTAGLGEELAVRGVLQPRLGILLSNLFFTSLHAFQYSWDALLVVFLVGMACGLVRKYTNTTTSAIVHGTYNFLLVMLAVLQIPGLSQ